MADQAAQVGVEPIGGQGSGRRRSSASETIDAVVGALRRSSNSFTKAKEALSPGSERLLEAPFIKAPVKGKIGRHKRRHLVLCSDRVQWYVSADAAVPKGELLDRLDVDLVCQVNGLSHAPDEGVKASLLRIISAMGRGGQRWGRRGLLLCHLLLCCRVGRSSLRRLGLLGGRSGRG